MEIRHKEAKNILTKSSIHHGYSANPYVGCSHKCVYCYAEYMKNWTGHEDEKWGEFIDVKEWEPLTDKQKRKLRGESIFMSSATDPYQPLEREYRNTRNLLEQLSDSEADVTVVTKSDMVLRDAELLHRMNATVAMSINTLDEDFRSDMDCACTIERRIKALGELHQKGVHTVCFISPVFPGITDASAIIQRVDGLCDEVWLEQLVLNYPYKGPIMYYVKTKYPEVYPYYDLIYNKGDNSGWDRYDEFMGLWCADNGFEYYHDSQPKENRTRPIVINQRGHKEFKEKYANRR